MRASSPSIEHGSRHWTVTGAPSPVEMDAAVVPHIVGFAVVSRVDLA